MENKLLIWTCKSWSNVEYSIGIRTSFSGHIQHTVDHFVKQKFLGFFTAYDTGSLVLITEYNRWEIDIQPVMDRFSTAWLHLKIVIMLDLCAKIKRACLTGLKINQTLLQLKTIRSLWTNVKIILIYNKYKSGSTMVKKTNMFFKPFVLMYPVPKRFNQFVSDERGHTIY